MRLRKFKTLAQGAAPAAANAAEDARTACVVGAPTRPAGRVWGVPSLHDVVLALQRILGGTLSGIGVSILVGNILVCLSLLLLGPTFVVGLLPA